MGSQANNRVFDTERHGRVRPLYTVGFSCLSTSLAVIAASVLETTGYASPYAPERGGTACALNECPVATSNRQPVLWGSQESPLRCRRRDRGFESRLDRLSQHQSTPHREVAQSAAYLVWTQGAAGSNPAFPTLQAEVVELAYTLVLETSAFGIEGSTPSFGI